MNPAVPLHIDLVRVRDMAAGCGFSLAELHAFYAPRARQEIEELTAAVDGGDRAGAARVAHGAAGSSASVGMASLSALYRALDTVLRDPTSGEVRSEVEAVGRHLGRCLEELARLAAQERGETR